MTALVPFLFEDEHLVRTMMRAGEPWFVLADVCLVLDIANPRDAASRLDDDEKDGVGIADAIGREQQTTIINESGLYSLILTSRKPSARRFKKWVTGTVLPSIQKTGGYSTGREKAINPAADRHVIQLARELKAETDPTIRRMLHALLERGAEQVGIEAPPLDALGQDAPPPPAVPAIVVEFWAAVAALEASRIRVNHSPDPDLIAINLPDLAQRLAAGPLAITIDGELHRALQRSTDPCFVAVQTVRSRIAKKTMRCWVFRRVSA